MNIAEAIPAAIGSHPSVTSVELVGSRASRDRHPFQDWDFAVLTTDFDSLAAALPEIASVLLPLSALWDPLAEHACYMLIVPGPEKVDLIFDEPNGDWPSDIDAHFWDWTLWLAGKASCGKDALVRSELEKMADFLLRPLGIREVPADVEAAVAAYLSVRPLTVLGSVVAEALAS